MQDADLGQCLLFCECNETKQCSCPDMLTLRTRQMFWTGVKTHNLQTKLFSYNLTTVFLKSHYNMNCKYKKIYLRGGGDKKQTNKQKKPLCGVCNFYKS